MTTLATTIGYKIPMRRLPSSLLLPFLLAVAGAEEPMPAIRLVPLRDGFRAAAPDGNLARIGETDLAKTALAAGVDLARPPHPIIAWGRKDDRLFYVFYKTTGNALGDRPYLIQRIKKIERAWKAPGAAPEENVTYQVEVFKTIGGELKRADEHFGSYALGDNYRREVVKEYEIGFGEVPGVCEGKAWPFDAGTLYRMLQEYQADEGLFPQVKFERTCKWTLAVSFGATGHFSVSSPELGFRAPEKLPDRNATLPPVDPASKGIVLLEGYGIKGIAVGKSSREDLVRVLGEPIEDAEVGLGHHNLSFPGGLTVNIDPKGTVNTIFTRAGFGGRTAKGATHGMYRDEIARLYGLPPKSAPDAEHWRYLGVQFSFDGFDRVKRIVIMRRK